jgi:murein DD-endopeptidase MepM/ murein hydrolase activator NlpD
LADEQRVAELENSTVTTPEVAAQPVIPVVAPVVSEEPVVMRRDRSNRPPRADVAVQATVVEPVVELPDPVAAEANTPIVGMPVIAPTFTDQKPVINELPATTASLPAPISLIAQTSTPAEPTPSVKVRLKHKRRSGQPQIVAPKSRKRRGAQIFSMVAMAFVAGLAIATSVPANALLSPEQVALQAELARTSTLAIGDGQSVEGTGENVNAGRDGVSVSAAQAAPTAGAYAPKKLNVNVPVSTNGMRWPVDEVKISSPFGARSLWGTYNFHTGLDFDPAYGTPIYAVADGIVSLVENPGPTCGVAVFIEHNVDGTKFTSVYCHMVIGSPTVTAGETVKKGDFVGNIGLTGITTGPHLHLEIRIADAPIDPYSFLVQHAGKAPNEVRS